MSKKDKTEATITTLPLYFSLLDIDPFIAALNDASLKAAALYFYITWGLMVIVSFWKQSPPSTQAKSPFVAQKSKIKDQINEEQDISDHSNADYKCQLL